MTGITLHTSLSNIIESRPRRIINCTCCPAKLSPEIQHRASEGCLISVFIVRYTKEYRRAALYYAYSGIIIGLGLGDRGIHICGSWAGIGIEFRTIGVFAAGSDCAQNVNVERL